MAKYLFEGKIKTKSSRVAVRLLLFHFQDENKVHFVYAPHLDLTGYGYNLEEARKSFEITLEEFIDYTVKKKTIGKLLTDLGWELKGKSRMPKKVIAPGITSVISKNEYVSEIFDKYPVNTFHEEVDLPVLQ